MTSVAIFFMLPGLGGGSTTFTAHLWRAFEAVGWRPTIYRVKERGEDKTRPFAKYEGVAYRNVTHAEARNIVKSTPSIMSAAAPSREMCDGTAIRDLMRLGMRIVVHDPNEFKIYDHLQGWSRGLPTRPFCIRPTMRKFLQEAIFVPHPYARSTAPLLQEPSHDRWLHAISVARIASVKRPKMILEANRLLDEELRVRLMGAEHRLYTWQLAKKYPEFKQSGRTWGFPMTFDGAVELCARARYNVDMTYFPDDGGGTQYAQMEAMDAGCVNVMHQDWFRYGGELVPGEHVLAVDGPQALAAVLRRGLGAQERAEVVERCYRLLERHAPDAIGQRYAKEMMR
jgi:hypothetical protein